MVRSMAGRKRHSVLAALNAVTHQRGKRHHRSHRERQNHEEFAIQAALKILLAWNFQTFKIDKIIV
jgi:hypothetical protein